MRRSAHVLTLTAKCSVLLGTDRLVPSGTRSPRCAPLILCPGARSQNAICSERGKLVVQARCPQLERHATPRISVTYKQMSQRPVTSRGCIAPASQPFPGLTGTRQAVPQPHWLLRGFRPCPSRKVVSSSAILAVIPALHLPFKERAPWLKASTRSFSSAIWEKNRR
jgi:hypothetical protein